MENDNIYPLDGQAFVPFTPAPQQQANSEKREATLAQLPLLKEFAERLSERIEHTDSIQQALAICEEYEISKDEALVAMDLVRKQLEKERSYLLSRIDSAAQ